MRGVRRGWMVLVALLAACQDGTEPHVPHLWVPDRVLEARGDTASLEALSNGVPVGAEWKSLDPSIVTVTEEGLASAVAAGEALVQATFGGVVDTGTVRVLPPVAVRVSDLAVVTDPSGRQGVRMRVRNEGGRGYYRLEFWKHDDHGAKRRILFYSTDTEAAPGLDMEHQNFLGDGVAEWVVAYSREPLSDVPVRTGCARRDGEPEPCPSDLPDPPAAVDSLVVLPAAAILDVGDSLQYEARAFAGGTELTGREVTWSTPSPEVISLSGTGMATALRSGYGQVNATVEGFTVAVAVTVASAHPGDTLAVAPLTLPTATQGRVYAAQLVATGGDGVYAWAVETGTLPTGVALSGGGALTGTPADGGTFTFTARVTDGAGRTATRALALTVERAPTIQTWSLPPAEHGEDYVAQLRATGGSGSYGWTVADGALPDGLALSAAGVVSGIPTVVGRATFTVRVTDEASATHERTFTVVVADVVQLVSGSPVTGIGGDAGSARYYGLAVPSGAHGLTIGISGGSGDVDLYVRHGSLPMEYVYDCRPLRTGNDETCTFTLPAAGQWYVMLRGYAAYAGVSLTAHHDG